MSTLGARIKAGREERGMSKVDLARAAGLSSYGLANIEAGRSNPHLDTVERVAEAFGVSVEDLFITGPAHLDISFSVTPNVDLGPLATLEARIREAFGLLCPALPLQRIGVWPWGEDVDPRFTVLTTRVSVIRLRAPSSVVPALAEATGRELAGLARGLRLAAPVIRPVVPVAKLRVLMHASSRDAASSTVLRETTAAGCCPILDITGKRALGSGSAWVVNLSSVPMRSSAVLQRRPALGPDCMFVPA